MLVEQYVLRHKIFGNEQGVRLCEHVRQLERIPFANVTLQVLIIHVIFSAKYKK